MKKIFNKIDGFTLIEIILTLVIVGVVFAIFTSIFAPNYILYLRASDEAVIHSELNIINTKMHNKLINSSDVEPLDSIPTSFTAGYHYYYINGDSKMEYVSNTGESTILSNDLIFDQFSLSLKRSTDDQNYIDIYAATTYGKADHEMRFDIMLNNITEQLESADNIGVKFK